MGTKPVFGFPAFTFLIENDRFYTDSNNNDLIFMRYPSFPIDNVKFDDVGQYGKNIVIFAQPVVDL
jgi:hypothetical protein